MHVEWFVFHDFADVKINSCTNPFQKSSPSFRLYRSFSEVQSAFYIIPILFKWVIFNYIMTKTSFDEIWRCRWWWCPLCTRPTRCAGFLKCLLTETAVCRLTYSPLSWFRANQSLLLFFNTACLEVHSVFQIISILFRSPVHVLNCTVPCQKSSPSFILYRSFSEVQSVF